DELFEAGGEPLVRSAPYEIRFALRGHGNPFIVRPEGRDLQAAPAESALHGTEPHSGERPQSWHSALKEENSLGYLGKVAERQHNGAPTGGWVFGWTGRSGSGGGLDGLRRLLLLDLLDLIDQGVGVVQEFLAIIGRLDHVGLLAVEQVEVGHGLVVVGLKLDGLF